MENKLEKNSSKLLQNSLKNSKKKLKKLTKKESHCKNSSSFLKDCTTLKAHFQEQTITSILSNEPELTNYMSKDGTKVWLSG